VHFRKILVRFCALFEVNHEILCIFGRSSLDFGWGTLKYAQSYEELPKMHKIPRGTSKYAQNPRRNFQKCTKSHEELPKLNNITWGISKKVQNPTMNFQKGFCAVLEFPHGKAYTCPFHPFTFSLQNTYFCNMHTDWLRQSLAATSSKRHLVITFYF
jgi:hypothetical protein